MYIPQPCAQRVHRNPPTYIHPPSVGMIYPISTYIFKWHILPKLLASYIQYKYIFLKMYIPQTCTRRTHSNPATYIHPPSVGMIYPISTYIFKWHILSKLLASYIQSEYIFLKHSNRVSSSACDTCLNCRVSISHIIVMWHYPPWLGKNTWTACDIQTTHRPEGP